MADGISPSYVKRLCISFQLSSNRIYLTLKKKKNPQYQNTASHNPILSDINRHTNGPLLPLSLGSDMKMKGGLTIGVQMVPVASFVGWKNPIHPSRAKPKESMDSTQRWTTYPPPRL